MKFKVRYLNRANGDSSEYERLGGSDSEAALKAHVGTKIDWMGARAEVASLTIVGDRATFCVRAAAKA